MHTNTIRRVLSGMLVGAGLAAATLAGTGNAEAVSTDQYDRVRYMWCGNGVAELEFTNSLGNRSTEVQDMSQGCRFYDYTESDEYGGYASAWITDDNGGNVSCTIWRNGVIVAKSNDSSDYYSYAGCY